MIVVHSIVAMTKKNKCADDVLVYSSYDDHFLHEADAMCHVAYIVLFSTFRVIHLDIFQFEWNV